MKIVCDNCATKYSIADEKVRGKVFKIRCKKCSHIIVVRGNEGAAAVEAGGDGFPGDDPKTTIATGGVTAGAGADSVWHLVVDREQIGPLTAAEVREKFAAGQIDVETYGWREGFADWLRLGSIDDFRDLGGARAEPGHEDGAQRRSDGADLFSGSNSQEDSGDAGSDLFGAAAQAAPAPAVADAFGAGGGGLFGAPEQAAPAPSRASRTSSPGFAAQPHGMAAAMGGGGEAVADGGRQMTGQRNENSVLFSLNNLQALASGGGGGGGAPAPKSGVDNRPGFANSQTEGSGLIDIRAMAASTLAASPSSSRGGNDSEMSAAPIFSPMAAPILMPAAPSGAPKWIWAVLGVGVLAVLGIVVVGILLLTRKPEPAAVVAAGPGTQPRASAGNPGATATPLPSPTERAALDKLDKTDKPEAKATAPDKTDDKLAAKGHEQKAAKPREAKAEKAAAKPAAKTENPGGLVPPPSESAPVAAPKRGGKKDALDDLLDGAAPDKPGKVAKHEAAEPSGGGDDTLSDQLEKSQIVAGMGKVKGRVQACYDQFKVPGTASVNMTIQHTGSVGSVSVGGSFSGTPTGSCVEKAVKGASFPRFKGAPMALTYPFMLR